MLKDLQWQKDDLHQGLLFPEYLPLPTLYCLQIFANKLHRRRASEGVWVGMERVWLQVSILEQLPSEFRVLCSYCIFFCFVLFFSLFGHRLGTYFSVFNVHLCSVWIRLNLFSPRIFSPPPLLCVTSSPLYCPGYSRELCIYPCLRIEE